MRKNAFYIQNIVRVQAVLFLIFALPLQTLKAQSDPEGCGQNASVERWVIREGV